ncbi:MAG: HAD family hydrolase [Fibrobacterota bacterium]
MSHIWERASLPESDVSKRGMDGALLVSGDTTTLVLWDIDGTLLETAGEGKRAFYATLETMFPGRAWPDIDMAGRTDFGIWHELAAAGGLADPPPFSDFGERYGKVMAEFFAATPPTALMGALELCRCIDEHPGFHNGLVTGNFFEGTRVKLQALGLWDLFTLDGQPVGGYGDHHPDKGPLALHALEGWYRRYPDRKVKAVVVGDTPEDVRSAKVARIACLGVAPGRFSTTDLLECGADAAVQNLSDIDGIISLLDRIAK